MLRYLIFLLPILLAGCSSPRSTLEQIQESGELRVVTRNGPTTFYEGPDGPAGIEYELVSRFAKYIGVKPKFIIPKTFREIIPAIATGEADIAAAGLTVTDTRAEKVRFSTPYQTIITQVVYLGGQKRPRKVNDLLDRKLSVIAGSSHEELLNTHKNELPGLTWEPVSNTTLELQLSRVVKKEIDYTIGDSNDIALNRRYYPTISTGFDLSEPQKLAWALTHTNDDSLYHKTIEFFKQLKKDGELEQLIEKYYGHMQRLNFVDKRTFWRHAEDRLPRYRPYFEEAARLTKYDWRLLAAIGYQESHWNPEAISPTGVRGIMMLTRNTAKQLGIKNRLSPEKSILGGAKYLRLMEKKIPRRVKSPDRIWLALAGYNVGMGHLEDARILTEKNGDDPDKWVDVKKHLPSLSKPDIYESLKYGYARGQEPVDYVDNIRNFYDLLLWKDKQIKKSQSVSINPIPSVL